MFKKLLLLISFAALTLQACDEGDTKINSNPGNGNEPGNGNGNGNGNEPGNGNGTEPDELYLPSNPVPNGESEISPMINRKKLPKCGGLNTEAGNVKFRIMAANITSGDQSYREPGLRIFRGLQPDIVLIQEFRYKDGTKRKMVDETFGKDFYYYVGKSATGHGIPNGVISRYPIIDWGEWRSKAYSDRNWTWTVIDLPGKRDLLAVSVHLSTSENASEMEPLIKLIAEKQNECNYYVVMGGDFNTKSNQSVKRYMSSLFHTDDPYPKDNNGSTKTNAHRKYQYDWLLSGKEFKQFEVPVVIGDNTFEYGLVFDSRVYRPLSDVAPVEHRDSGAPQMQHMPVIKNYEFKAE